MDRISCGNNNNKTDNNNSTGPLPNRTLVLAQVDDITNELDRMNVDLESTPTSLHEFNVDQPMTTTNIQSTHLQSYPFALKNNPYSSTTNFSSQLVDNNFQQTYYGSSYNTTSENVDEMMITQQENNFQQQLPQLPQQQQQQQDNNNTILIVTNVDSNIFTDKLLQAKFESLFTAYDSNVTFRYLKSFRRVRLDFTDSRKANSARLNLSQYKLGNTVFKCFNAQIIKPNNNGDNNPNRDSSAMNACYSTHLNIPKLTKQFLISPPASPPEGWEPVIESSPCIDVQLISAIANLVPGEVHEIHPASESQPGIYVEVCEDPQFANESSAMQRSCSRIPKTMSPAGFSNQIPPL